MLSLLSFGQQHWIAIALAWALTVGMTAFGLLDRVAKPAAIVFALTLVLWALAVYVAIVVPLSRLQVLH